MITKIFLPKYVSSYDFNIRFVIKIMMIHNENLYI